MRRCGAPSPRPSPSCGSASWRSTSRSRPCASDGSLLQLTPHEFRLLRLFALNEGKLLTHRTILSEVWGAAYQTESHYLHVYVSQLRRKIEPDPARPRYLLTETGAGYRFVDPKS